jgi:NAD(P) transhydrogenase subunit alpha
VNLFVPKETKFKENRVAITPDVAKELVNKGFKLVMEKNAGQSSYFSDEMYTNVGVTLLENSNNGYENADVVLKVNVPEIEEIKLMKKGSILISFVFAATVPQIIEAAAEQGITIFSMDAIPRISRAQKMDALSSQSNLAGYKTVILAADALGKIFPMLMTAAGTIKPARVLIMGAGVAGLQAIATAKRLGAIVEVSDIRPETKEQVQSLGAYFIEVKGDESMQTAGGYVTGVSEDFLVKQQALLEKHVADADIVITTALIPGKKAPMLIPASMVEKMKMGSVIVDMAVEQGGNCALSELNKTVVKNGVTIIGESNLPSLLPMNASQLYAKNISTFLYHLADSQGFKWEMEEEITKGSLIVHNGSIVHASASPKI